MSEFKIKGYAVTVVESDGTVFMSSTKSRDEALKITNAAEKVRNCQAWRITYVR